jgi:hypothetical protein
VSVTFDAERGYVASAPELRQPIVALSLGGLRRRIEIALLPDDVRVVLQLDGLAERERTAAERLPPHPPVARRCSCAGHTAGAVAERCRAVAISRGRAGSSTASIAECGLILRRRGNHNQNGEDQRGGDGRDAALGDDVLVASRTAHELTLDHLSRSVVALVELECLANVIDLRIAA